MFDTITVPAAVAAELKSVLVPDWVRVVSIPQGAIPHVIEAGLGRGETEAIHLALHLGPDRLLPDDGVGRREAKRLGTPGYGCARAAGGCQADGTSSGGSAGSGYIAASGFRVLDGLYRELLASCGEI